MPQNTLQEDIQKYMAPFKSLVKRKGKGILRHDYLVPGGPYEEQWDWDAFFMGMALAAEIPSEAIFLKNWALNYLENAENQGFVSGCITPNGLDPRLKQIKPVLAQGCFHASNFLNDFSWITQHLYEKLKKIVLYREYNGYFIEKFHLGCWTDSMESGADNNPALLHYPEKSVLAVDFNVFSLLEYRAMRQIAIALKKEGDALLWKKKSEILNNAILQHLWSQSDEGFFNINLQNERFIPVVSYSSIHPFWAGIASQEQADTFFKHYLLNEEKMLSPHGIRSLSKDDPFYNNANIIKPHSNWQGPIWPIATYFYIISLGNYGYWDEAEKIAEKIIRICVQDIQQSGGMHENYDAETGLPLAAPNFISWNLLLINTLQQIQSRTNPFFIAP
ncbi:hypothetical protein IPN35_00320 [Candidatus Peregrinibacteria bacterium]|nr:MAG: hypothetical protein IPN35_00320 [Candidatus Peregrinibacteria bacterium]